MCIPYRIRSKESQLLSGTVCSGVLWQPWISFLYPFLKTLHLIWEADDNYIVSFKRVPKTETKVPP